MHRYGHYLLQRYYDAIFCTDTMAYEFLGIVLFLVPDILETIHITILRCGLFCLTKLFFELHGVYFLT